MGNTVDFVSKVPDNLSKSNLLQLQEIIEEGIIRSPWTEIDLDQSKETILRRTLTEMQKRGYRPITPEEYQAALDRKEKRICLWMALEDFCHEKESVLTLPSTKSELTERIEFFRTMTDDSAAVLTDAETVAWAATVNFAQ